MKHIKKSKNIYLLRKTSYNKYQKEDKMKTGIIILNYNDSENTIKMLNQIKEYSCLSKIVVVDNCSTDDSVEKIEEYTNRKIILIKAEKNLGYAAGNNLGLKYLEQNTSCEIAVVSNPDILVEESVLKELIHDMKTNENIAFLGPKILENGTISKGWKFPTFLSELISNINYFGKYSHRLLKYYDNYYEEKLTKVDVIHGCFFLARMKAFKKIRYFDPHTFLYYEENILAKKAQQKNLGIYVDVTVGVTHALSQSVDKSLKKIQKYKMLKKSQQYYLKEYMHLNIIGYGFIRMFYYLSLFFSYLTFWI